MSDERVTDLAYIINNVCYVTYDSGFSIMIPCRDIKAVEFLPKNIDGTIAKFEVVIRVAKNISYEALLSARDGHLLKGQLREISDGKDAR